MAGPYIVSIVFVLGIIVLCAQKPNAGRTALALFYLVMALGVNGMFILTSPGAYADYAAMSFWPVYRDLALWTIDLLTPVVLGLLLVAYELAITVLLLGRGRAVKLGLVGVILFVAGIAPMSLMQMPWLGLAVAAGYLLRHEYRLSAVELLEQRAVPQAAG